MTPPHPPTDAARLLRHARKFRAAGDFADFLEYAHSAYHVAYDAGDGVLCYRAKAAIGHGFYYRACYEDAYNFFWQALQEARAWDVRQWLAAAFHDCWLSYSELAEPDPERIAEYGAGMANGWEPFPHLAWRFIHNHALLRDAGTQERERARFLASAALSAGWHTVNRRAGRDEYEVYQGKFERMVAYAGMVQGFGGCGLLEQWRRAQNLFDMAAEDLGTYEGYALCMVACANGAHRVGERLTAATLLHRAIAVADRRGETAVIACANRLREGWQTK